MYKNTCFDKHVYGVLSRRTRRVGVIGHHTYKGLGNHGIQAAFRGLPGAEITAVSEPDEQCRNLLIKETGAGKSYSGWKELLEREAPDIVCVSSRLPSKHTDAVIAACGVGCHVYCEKPLAESLEEADRMIDAADSGGAVLAAAHLGRYSPAFRKFKSMISRGDIGRPLAVYSRGKEDHRGGGEDMLVLGSHLFDLSRFLFGNPEWLSAHITVEGRPAALSDRHEPAEPVGPVLGDEITVMYGFSGGVRGYFESRKGLFDGKNPRMYSWVAGTEGTLSIRYDTKEIRIRRGRNCLQDGGEYAEVGAPCYPGVPGAEPIPEPDSRMGEGFDFAFCNRQAAVDLILASEEGREPACSGRDARWALEMISAAYLSHLSGNSVKLPLELRAHPLSMDKR